MLLTSSAAALYITIRNCIKYPLDRELHLTDFSWLPLTPSHFNLSNPAYCRNLSRPLTKLFIIYYFSYEVGQQDTKNRNSGKMRSSKVDETDFITESRSRDSPVRCIPLTLNACKYSMWSLYNSVQYSLTDYHQKFITN